MAKYNEWLLFDTFGTLLDWRGSIDRQIEWAAPGVLTSDARQEFAKHWAHGYGAGTAAVVAGEKPFRVLSEILSDAFDECVTAFCCPFSNEQKARLRHAWDRLDPWTDVVPAMRRLSERYRLASFTNADTMMLLSMTAYAGLPFDFLFSAEHARAYKPDPRMYEAARRFVGGNASRITLVASHTFDLNASAKVGMNTALVSRAEEPGGDPRDTDHPLTWLAKDLGDLADQMLGASHA